jgi:hypothetical protein
MKNQRAKLTLQIEFNFYGSSTNIQRRINFLNFTSYTTHIHKIQHIFCNSDDDDEWLFKNKYILYFCLKKIQCIALMKYSTGYQN